MLFPACEYNELKFSDLAVLLCEDNGNITTMSSSKELPRNRPLKCRCKLTFRNFHNREVPFSHLNNTCKKFISFLRKMGILDIIPVFISIARVVSQLLSIVYLLINSVFRLSADQSDEE